MQFTLIGIPDDVGVRNVGGRIGAAEGPKAFRECFQKFKGKIDIHQYLKDAGDVGITNDISINHQNAISLIKEQHTGGNTSIIIGGGHDHGYTQLEGIRQAINNPNAAPLSAKQIIGCINIDPHFDLRKPNPEITSGSPYYLALEKKVIEGKNFVEFGIQSHCNAKELWNYAESKNINIIPFETIRNGNTINAFNNVITKLSRSCDYIVLSLDLDCFQAGFAPGVSAPAADGFIPSEILEILSIAAAEKKVISLGIFELNPKFDVDGHTARLAALCAWQFISKKNG